MQGIGCVECRFIEHVVEVEDASRIELSGCRLATGDVVRLEEKVVIVEPAPGQLLIFARSAGRNGDDMQVISEANRVPGSLELLDEFAPGISGINTQRDRLRLLQGEPDCYSARLRAAQHGAREDERQVRESLG